MLPLGPVIMYRRTQKSLRLFLSLPSGWRSLVALADGKHTSADMRRLLSRRFTRNLECALYALYHAGLLEVC